MKKSLLLLALLVLAIGPTYLSACGYGAAPVTPAAPSAPEPVNTPPTTTPPANSPPAPPPETSQPPSAAVAAVIIEDYAYSPATITVKAGTTVTWTNNDSAAHTVTADNRSFDSGSFGRGKTYTHVFNTPGTYSYYCALHPYMTGKVIVE